MNPSPQGRLRALPRSRGQRWPLRGPPPSAPPPPSGDARAQSRDLGFHKQRSKGPPSLCSRSCTCSGQRDTPGDFPKRGDGDRSRQGASLRPSLCPSPGGSGDCVHCSRSTSPAAAIGHRFPPQPLPASRAPSPSPPGPNAPPHADLTYGPGRRAHRRGPVPQRARCARPRGARWPWCVWGEGRRAPAVCPRITSDTIPALSGGSRTLENSPLLAQAGGNGYDTLWLRWDSRSEGHRLLRRRDLAGPAAPRAPPPPDALHSPK